MVAAAGRTRTWQQCQMVRSDRLHRNYELCIDWHVAVSHSSRFLVVCGSVCLFRFTACLFYWVSTISAAGSLGHLCAGRHWIRLDHPMDTKTQNEARGIDSLKRCHGRHKPQLKSTRSARRTRFAAVAIAFGNIACCGFSSSRFWGFGVTFL